ncbi:hypothetical protein DVR12_07380 [Chitinophaga silvatica]|uniref:Glycosyl-hydrolase family 116 catalytic region domain-containing protein n=1 Tax=Chitinophaga silvatica TaxID=2282649 RepID=A0A3E1YEU3_9BACT|nr:GH116 family glycosyl hydrolase [Chitinophaga silvatica]RFS24999.1 hypothetical protein DVR12_07380 [Chitinophaga silvatica]
MNNQNARRVFLKQAGLLSAALSLSTLPVVGKYLLKPQQPGHNIPVDKNLDPQWVQSLYNRESNPTTYFKSKNELKYIGMPVGGLHTGTVYAGGDGRLWLWQIFNESMEGVHEGINPVTVTWNDGKSNRQIRPRDGAAYVAPPEANKMRVLEQGFAIQIKIGDKTIIKELKEDDWDEVSFLGSYPTCLIRYESKDCPVGVSLSVGSPFIPLDVDNSSLPMTFLHVMVVNKSKENISVTVTGWLENGANKLSAKPGNGKKHNKHIATTNNSSIFMSFDAIDPKLKTSTDAGTMCLTLHDKASGVHTGFNPTISNDSFNKYNNNDSLAEAPDKLIGSISATSKMAPNDYFSPKYSISWHFNHPHPQLIKLVPDAAKGYYYGKKFKDALEVSKYVQTNFNYLTDTANLWTYWQNASTLPYWFLDRTFLNLGTLATANTYRFASGRFWSWEGIGACAGTCTHVWQYAHAMARVFPTLERDMRQRVDLGTGFYPDSGAIRFRGENENRPAIDGQAGTILRFYREHQMSEDDTFLKTNWPSIKKAVKFMMAQDKNGDGMIDTPMENTLDAVWEGEIAWIVGLCIAAAEASKAMALEMNDTEFAKTCKTFVTNGRKNMEQHLFNGEYFIHRPDAKEGRQKLGSYNTCHIDQVYGQSWAFQVGLPRILDKDKTISALKALWKYNFTADVGPYIQTHLGGRPYVLPGEGGMIMNTNPANEAKPYGENTTWQLGYFHECMSGFEHQVAAHMMAEGMVDESLILTRMIHDRYHPAKRNPFNEIECSDHYARAMASYGTFISACGFTYHGPKATIGFAPKIDPKHFSTPFITAKGWGSYYQSRTEEGQHHGMEILYGTLKLEKLNFELIKKREVKSVTVLVERLTDKLVKIPVPATFSVKDNQLTITLNSVFNFIKMDRLKIDVKC